MTAIITDILIKAKLGLVAAFGRFFFDIKLDKHASVD
jgi:hypothetical protein